ELLAVYPTKFNVEGYEWVTLHGRNFIDTVYLTCTFGGKHVVSGPDNVAYLNPTTVKCRTPEFLPSDSKVTIQVSTDGVVFSSLLEKTMDPVLKIYKDAMIPLTARIRVLSIAPRL
ncbi:unnamed protein product, partial [Amoebophrya sp. A120]